MSEDIYHTLAAPSKGLFKDKGSKFMAFAFPVSEEEEAKRIIKDLKKKYHNARHHCYAYRLGITHHRIRDHDDGEPGHTAGKPILGQIISKELTNVLIVVVRYFGGTLLGISGLINAYKNAASDALQNGKIITKPISEMYLLTFDYPLLNIVKKITDEEKLELLKQNFDQLCSFEIGVPKKEADRIYKLFSSIKGMTIQHSGR